MRSAKVKSTMDNGKWRIDNGCCARISAYVLAGRESCRNCPALWVPSLADGSLQSDFRDTAAAQRRYPGGLDQLLRQNQRIIRSSSAIGRHYGNGNDIGPALSIINSQFSIASKNRPARSSNERAGRNASGVNGLIGRERQMIGTD